MMRLKVIKSGAVVAAGQLVSQILIFVRNLVVARLISREDFGIAATFAMTVTLLEAVSDLSFGLLIVQSPRGDDPKLQNVSHALAAWRGFMTGLILLLLAGPITALFNIPQASWAFRWLALAPVFRGLAHQDTCRLQRSMKFVPAILPEVISHVLAGLMVWPIVKWCGDYSAMLWLLLLQRGSATACSYLVAQRRYRWAWDVAEAREILRFGWPFAVNGLVMIGMFQGDRFIIGAAYTMGDFAVYSLAMGLALLPATSVANIGGAVLLPVLARGQSSPQERAKAYGLCMQLYSLIGGVMGIVLIVGGKTIIAGIYGSKYSGAAVLIPWLAATQFLRLVGCGVSLIAIAYGNPKILLISNLARNGGLVLAAAFAFSGMELQWVAVAALLGEIPPLMIGLTQLQRHQRLPILRAIKPLTLAGLGVCAAAITLKLGAGNGGISAATFLALGLTLGLSLLLLSSMLLTFTDFRRECLLGLEALRSRSLAT